MITQEILKRLLEYDEKTGSFTWKVSPSRNVRAGESAGSVTSEMYTSITIMRKHYQAHRLAWLYVHGVWPKSVLDHIDTNRVNNRISNLREASFIENGQNRIRPQTNNTTGMLGVYQLRGRKNWRAQIRINKKQVYLGTFKTIGAAHDAYLAAKREFHPFGML